MSNQFNPVTASLQDVAQRLADGRLNSEVLVKTYLARIDTDNTSGLGLRAIIETAPRDKLLRLAKKLDQERRAGKTLGPLHGVPIVVKDAIATDYTFGMETTNGSNALIGCKPVRNAEAIEHFVQSGAIILRKANQTSLGGFIRSGATGGSLRGGQCVSPHGTSLPVRGSSSGSAIAVTAGFCAAALGTQTWGSTDAIGIMGKTAWDVAAMLTVAAGNNTDYTTSTQNADIARFKIGISRQNLSPEVEHTAAKAADDDLLFEQAIQALRPAIKVDSVECGAFTELKKNAYQAGWKDGKWLGSIPELPWYFEYKDAFEEYLSMTEGGKVRSFDQLVQYHRDHPAIYYEYLRRLEELGKEIEDVFVTLDLDAIVFGGGNWQGMWAPITGDDSGLPIMVIPCGTSTDNYPYGLFILGQRGREDQSLEIAAALEPLLPARPVPGALKEGHQLDSSRA